jgi:hypothetical protein
MPDAVLPTYEEQYGPSIPRLLNRRLTVAHTGDRS